MVEFSWHSAANGGWWAGQAVAHNISGPMRATADAVAYGCARHIVSIRSRPFVWMTPIPVVTTAAPLMNTRLDGREPDRQGKVRDLFDAGSSLLIVATDRISAFDYVLGSGIPDKGKVLTQLSAFWFARTAGIVPNHLLGTDPANVPAAVCRARGPAGGPRDAGAQDHAVPDRVRGARLSVGLGLEGLSADRRRVRRAPAGGPAGVGPAARADLHAGHQGVLGPRRQHH